ncbi:flagellar biosynthesis regulator FlaF [Sulfuricystis multivorans]|uniref:flagellar biosynthesis regulator FlaF n=1 Tax=Sulfuricystis multivorans TaxID=2211108 RepID=UPI000F828EDE|nr:flagellar biosynthesis regulator FlaF [Sulfuricystis multivorans]
MSSPLDAYRSVEKATLSGRDLEASVLLKAAQKLVEAQHRLADEKDLQTLDEALRYNQRVWTLFQSEISESANPLPEEIKTNLLALIGFIDRRTYALMAEPKPDRIDVLIEINRNIAGGLQAGSDAARVSEESQ